MGRSAAAKQLDWEAVRLAVIAHVRYTHTDYDDLLNRLGERMLARAEVRGDVDEMVRR